MTTNKTKRVTLFIKTDIVKHAKTQAIFEDITLTNLVEKALTEYLPEEIIIKKPKLKKIKKMAIKKKA